MDKFVIRTPTFQQTPIIEQCSKRVCQETNLDDLPADPGTRKRISKYNPNDRENIRRAYLKRGPCQPRGHTFPQKMIGKIKRKFNPCWFDRYKPWLEYSVKNDSVFCLYCYLCAYDGDESADTSFTIGGFSNWKKPERLLVHVGGIHSAHNKARRACEDLMNPEQHIGVSFFKQDQEVRIRYEIRLLASVHCVRFCLHQGLPFRGHDEKKESNNKGNFKELLKFLADHNEEIRKVVLDNAPGNHKLSSNKIQKDIASAYALETTKAIVEDIGDGYFSIMVDECRDASCKEQMALVLRYVNKEGYVIERFLGIIHVTDTCSLSLKEALESLLATHELSMSRIRGQGYDGASNMRGEFNGLKSLVLNDNKSAFYVHCFAHQLQLVLVAVAKNHVDIALLFTMLIRLVNAVGGSCKRRDMLREKQVEKILEELDIGEIKSGKGLHQEYTVQRATDTRWGSHYKTLINVGILFSSIREVLQYVIEDGGSSEQKSDALLLLVWAQSFDTAFGIILMRKILGITNELSLSLQRQDQDIVNSMNLVVLVKQRLEMMRNKEWESFVNEVYSFCAKHSIDVPNMDDDYAAIGRPRRAAHKVTNLHHYHIEIFKTMIDWVLQELNNRFTEVTTELLSCMACLSPLDSFSSFRKDKLVRLAEFYPSDFSEMDRVALDNQLETFFYDMKTNMMFNDLKGVGCLAAKLVETKKHLDYTLVYRLIKLILVLPVSTASVERAFSTMKIVKTRLRTKMKNDWLNDCLVTYIEKDVFESVSDEVVMNNFQEMKNRRGLLPKK